MERVRNMESIYYIYEIYNHWYSGFADYNGELVHFEDVSAVYNSPGLFEIIPATSEFLDIEIESEKYWRLCLMNEYPDILCRSGYCGERENGKTLSVLKSEYPTISDEQWEAAECEFQRYLFRDKYLGANRENAKIKSGITHVDLAEMALPYDHSFMEWLD